MGSGKTKIAIEACKHLRAKYMLVVAPKVALISWARELERWWPECPYTLWQGTPAVRAKRWESYLAEGGILLVNYALLRQLLEVCTGFGVVIYDEVHTLRNRGSAQFKHARGLQGRCVIGLTGSPVVNGAQDLWAPLHLVDRKRWRGFWNFANAYLEVRQDHYGTHIEGVKDAAALQADTQEYIFRLSREEVLADLPPKTRQIVPVPLSPAQQALYTTLATELLVKLGEDELGERWLMAPNTIALITRLRQLIVCPEVLGSTAENALLETLVRSVEESYLEGRPVLVFSPFAQALTGARQALDALGETYLIRGGMSAAEIGATVAAFQASRVPTRALLCTTSLGTSYTATAASTVLFLGCAWTPAANFQCEDRANRIGQQHPVYVRYLVGAGTVDQHIESILDAKTNWSALALDPRALLLPPSRFVSS